MTSPLQRLLRRLLVLLSLAALAAVVGSGTVASGAAPAPPPPTGSDVPSVGRVAQLFPHLDGGERRLFRSGELGVPVRGCFREIQESLVAPTARSAWFLREDGRRPFFRGQEEPVFSVFQYATRAGALEAFEAVRAYVDRCDRRREYDGMLKRAEEVPVPRMGRAQLGYRVHVGYTDLDYRSEQLEVWVLRGHRLERSWLGVRSADEPPLRRGVRMARLLADVARD